MTRNPNIAVVTIGYYTYALEDAQAALELMAIMSKAVQIDTDRYDLRNDTPCTHFLAEETSLPKLEFVAASKFNPNETIKEAKARFEREKQDRADMDQQFREAPPALEAPAAPTDVREDEVIF